MQRESGLMEQAGTGQRVVVIRYGELFLKSGPVMKHFIGILLQNIESALREEDLDFRIETPRGRIIIFGADTEAITRTSSRVFGVVDAGLCTLTGASPEELSTAVVTHATEHLSPGMSFAVRAKRGVKTGLPSPELAGLLGSAILDHVPGLRVDLECPDYEVHVEVRDIGGLVCGGRIPGPGGLPLGTQGSFISLLSPGIDSPVATWLMMKRGCTPGFLFLDAGSWSGADVRAGALENFRRLSLWCPGLTLGMSIVSAEALFHRMNRKKIPPRFRCVICKRFMYRIGNAIVQKKGALALVTGENLGQVASQTLTNLATITAAATVPVIRPLITYDKGEIVTLAREIGTFPGRGGDLSCRAVPSKPSTGAGLEEIENWEGRLDLTDLASEALAGSEEITVCSGRFEGR